MSWTAASVFAAATAASAFHAWTGLGGAMVFFIGLEIASGAGLLALGARADAAALAVLLILVRDALTCVLLLALTTGARGGRLAAYRPHGRALASAACAGTVVGTGLWVASDARTLAAATATVGVGVWLDTCRKILGLPRARADAAAPAGESAGDPAAPGPAHWRLICAVAGLASGVCGAWTGLAGPPVVPALEALKPSPPEASVALATWTISPVYIYTYATRRRAPRFPRG